MIITISILLSLIGIVAGTIGIREKLRDEAERLRQLAIVENQSVSINQITNTYLPPNELTQADDYPEKLAVELKNLKSRRDFIDRKIELLESRLKEQLEPA